MRHFLAQFGPALKLPWTKLEAPELTDELIDLVSKQSDEQAAGASIRALETRRDECLVAVLSALRGSEFGAGEVVRDHERRLREQMASPAPIADGRRRRASKPDRYSAASRTGCYPRRSIAGRNLIPRKMRAPPRKMWFPKCVGAYCAL
jgi:hypothetical protein